MAEKNPNESEWTDRSLLARYREGQADAATRLYLRYADRLRALAARQTASDLKSRVDPDDIVQSVFRTFFRRVARGEYEVPEGEELWKLFLVIALNKVRATGAHHHAARRDTRQTAGGEAFEDAVRKRADQDETALATLKMVIEETLAGLPDSQREIITLRIEGHDVDTIAARSGRAKRSVERVLQQFRDAMKKQLSGGE
jgi:RNA polymerase sigma-70 factor (ECF subfamily)